MRIHTVQNGEKIADIAREYGIKEDFLRLTNEIPRGEAAVGEELLVLTPTRSYTLREGDTPRGLGLRFEVGEEDIIMMNPWLNQAPPKRPVTVSLKRGERPYGGGAGCGYIYRGCDEKLIRQALPYMTYAIIGSGASEGGRSYLCYQAERETALVREAGCVPLLRIFNRREETGRETDFGKHVDSIINTARGADFDGVVLPMQGKQGEGLHERLSEMKRSLGEAGLLLFIEADEKTDAMLAREADGSIFSYMKCQDATPPSFADGERTAISDYACECESRCATAELASFARRGDGFVSVREAIATARESGAIVTSDDATLLSTFAVGRERYIYPSLKNIKATLDLVHEFGFMGVAFDIMRAPLNYLLMYDSLFKTHRYPRERAKEGCSQE